MKKMLSSMLCLLLMVSFSFAAAKKAEKKPAKPIVVQPAKELPKAQSPLLSAPKPSVMRSPLPRPFTPKLEVGGALRVRYNSDTFGISRARVRIWGEVAPTVSFLIQPNFAAASTGGAATFDDVYMELRHPLCSLRFGQFELPFAYASSKYKIIYGGGVGPGHYNTILSSRDYGVRVMGDLWAGFHYDAALVNGAGSAAADVNKSKDVVGRINYKNNFMDIGLSGYYGKAGAAETLKKDAAVDLEYKFNPFQLAAEYMLGGNAAATAKLQESSLQLSGVFGVYEPLIRYEAYDPDVNIAGNGVNTLTVGANYNIDQGARFSINYNIINEETTPVDNNALLMEFQVQL